jgi:hypothetical protein
MEISTVQRYRMTDDVALVSGVRWHSGYLQTLRFPPHSRITAANKY